MEEEIKPSKRLKIAAVIFFFLSALFFISCTVFYFSFSMIEDSQTTEYTATISEIRPITFYTIKTYEYNASFSVVYEDVVMDMEALSSLQKDQTITFSISNADIENLEDETLAIDFVSLKVGDIDIITLDSYNAYFLKVQREGCTTFSIADIIFLVIAILLLIIRKVDYNTQKIAPTGKLLFKDNCKTRKTPLLVSCVIFVIVSIILITCSIFEFLNLITTNGISRLIVGISGLGISIFLFVMLTKSRFFNSYVFISQDKIKFFANKEDHEIPLSNLISFNVLKEYPSSSSTGYDIELNFTGNRTFTIFTSKGRALEQVLNVIKNDEDLSKNDEEVIKIEENLTKNDEEK